MVNSTILIADDQIENRKVLKNILSSEYELLEADTAEKTIELMHWYERQLAAVLLDSEETARIDGNSVLSQWHKDDIISSIPVIAVTGKEDDSREAAAFREGVWDVIHKPFEQETVRSRITNVISRHELKTLERTQYIQKYDQLTGIYNKNMFLRATEEILCHNLKEHFAFIHMDIYQFHLVNQFYGISEANRLLQHIAKLLEKLAEGSDRFTYGRYRADVFCFCMPYEGEAAVVKMLEKLREDINKYRLEHVLVPVFGIYVIDDHRENIVMISDRANLAAKKCKGNYINNYLFYDTSMSEQMIKEQKIINSMKRALAKEEFVLYIQPKYDLQTNLIDGGEVLVRWMVPGKGMVPPGEFIPVFEGNGFIAKLDQYVWEHACQLIRSWLDKGRDPFPISVNISRVSLYNQELAEVIYGLTQKYGIEPRLLQLELTESAYSSNPNVIKKTMARLQEYGFCILMDDFGSGYSSLNTLKDIVVDILKIDMTFLKDSDKPGRGENILASVVRMAKWLEMPVIAEGVEKESQAGFLRSIGCEFVQGYFFAKPMPVDEYERMAFDGMDLQEKRKDTGHHDDVEEWWDAATQTELMFSNIQQAMAIYEYMPETGMIDTIRVNNAYYELFGYSDLKRMLNNMNAIEPEYRKTVADAFKTASDSRNVAQCEFRCINKKGSGQWVEMRLKYVRVVGKRSIIFATLFNITDRKEIEEELQKYRKAILASERKVETLLVVDDIEVSRELLRSMFESEYNILEASNGQEALDIVRENIQHIDLILLDVVMPVMDGKRFLLEKKKDETIREIPVVVITSDDSPQEQINALSMGANDYIVKPFVPAVVIRRVYNVLASQKQLSKLLKKTGDTVRDKDEYMPGMYNRNRSGHIVHQVMGKTKRMQALMLVDLDRVGQLYERLGQMEADRTIHAFADSLRMYFHKSDILARYRRDEFIIFMIDVPSQEFIEQKCEALLQAVQQSEQNDTELKYSIGIVTAMADENNSFMELLGYADEALARAKQMSGNQWYIYERK